MEGLLPNPSHERIVLDMLFGLAEWHGLAKLRMHTDSTVGRLRAATEYIGSKLRYFVKHITPTYKTKELPQEVATRRRRHNRQTAATQPQPHAVATPMVLTSNKPGVKAKLLNLITYKLHALGDYVAQILFFGTTDSYSTQPVSLASFLLLVYSQLAEFISDHVID